ncbi:hypothetical protein Nepgr_027551 [Nepenthes gracilis]|uniref:Exocyst subunit Exo70 family protein n=1 Tax=Nepenthes gracilis TaxID=150966 RepID=A0AAD3Y1J1_NEPGR|nr:hypothetical protein Nepgr_027551 [Nepenthes gracilis]
MYPFERYMQWFEYRITELMNKGDERASKYLLYLAQAPIRRILQSLSVQGLTSSGGGSSAVGADGGNSSGASRALVKERLRLFNMQFEELHQRQSQWTVPDTELRRLAVAEVLLRAYRSFIKRCVYSCIQKFCQYSRIFSSGLC